jgi:hypothetical protein
VSFLVSNHDYYFDGFIFIVESSEADSSDEREDEEENEKEGNEEDKKDSNRTDSTDDECASRLSKLLNLNDDKTKVSNAKTILELD